MNQYFAAISWIFVLLTIGSLAYSVYGAYNFYTYGNCDGPYATSACILNDLTGDYGRFSSPQELIAPTVFDGISAGNSTANVTVVEFGCFLCPYTRKAEPLVQELLANYSVNYVFKPFPLPNHNNSYLAAQAVLCANLQDKHWEMRRIVFEQQSTCSVDGSIAIYDLAEQAGLNVTTFRQCMETNQTTAELDRYVAQGKASHIYATPTFFVNGKPLVGAISIADFDRLIREG